MHDTSILGCGHCTYCPHSTYSTFCKYSTFNSMWHKKELSFIGDLYCNLWITKTSKTERSSNILNCQNLYNDVRHTTFDVRHTDVCRKFLFEIKCCRVPHAALPPCLCHLCVNPPYTAFHTVFPRFFKILRLFGKQPLSNLSLGLNKLCFEGVLGRTAR